VRYVLNHQHADGMLVSNIRGGPMYCHGISTLMLAEVVGMIPDAALADRVQKALSRAVDVIVKAQDVKKGPDHAGGWRYQPNSNDSDISVTGWQVMALRAAKSAGCAVDSTRIDRAVRYLKRCALKDGGFAYHPGQGPNNARTGVGILALELCGTHLTPEAIAGSKYLLTHPPRWGSDFFFYEAYYGSQAMFQIGDEAFQGYQKKLFLMLLEHQQQDGSWLSGDVTDHAIGRNYCTAMGVLALAVEYRYLPIYQR
jgi:Prenyltransferase and squalene oxidase repeat